MKSCSGAVGDPEGNPDPGVLHLQYLDELVWTPGGYGTKKTVCLHVCMSSGLRNIPETDESHECRHFRWE